MKSLSIQSKASLLLMNVIHNERLYPFILSSKSFITQGRYIIVNSDQSCPLLSPAEMLHPVSRSYNILGETGKITLLNEGSANSRGL